MILVLLMFLVQEISVFSAEIVRLVRKIMLLVRKIMLLVRKIVLLVLGFSANSANSANKDDEFD